MKYWLEDNYRTILTVITAMLASGITLTILLSIILAESKFDIITLLNNGETSQALFMVSLYTLLPIIMLVIAFLIVTINFLIGYVGMCMIISIMKTWEKLK